MSPLNSQRQRRVQHENDEPSLTKQSMKDEVDVNQIVTRFRTTGILSHLAKGQPRYLDVSEIGDFREALEHVRQVNDFFSQLPAPMRADFNNDPAEFIDWVTDPANAEEVRKYGLEPKADQVEQPPTEEPQPTTEPPPE